MKRHHYQILFITILIVCTALFFKEVNASGLKIANIDKIAHFGVFFILCAFLKRALKTSVWIYIALLSVYGGLVELIQGTLPHRQASFADFLADLAGVLAYLLLNYLWHTFNNRRRDV